LLNEFDKPKTLNRKQKSLLLKLRNNKPQISVIKLDFARPLTPKGKKDEGTEEKGWGDRETRGKNSKSTN
jgi:hypothetical protein